MDGVEENFDEERSDTTVSDIDAGADTFATTFAGLNALEIAAVSGSKKFLSQKAIQRIIDAIWKGDIVFWDTMSIHSTKRARIYNKDRSDPYCRLRVPLYLRLFEVLFFAGFLILYYIVLAQEDINRVTVAEIMLYIWFAAFSYNGMNPCPKQALMACVLIALQSSASILTLAASSILRTSGLCGILGS